MTVPLWFGGEVFVESEGGAVSGTRTRATIEWTTVLVLIGFGLAYLAVVAFHASIPWPVQLVALWYLGGLWLSLGHELLHGHPTRWKRLNASIWIVPLALWIPYGRYRTLHIQHHRSDLTDPFDDTESSYVAPTVWQQAGPMKRRYLLLLRTTPGRFTVGVPRTVLRFWWKEAQGFGDPVVRNPWLLHVVVSVPFCWWMFGVMGMNPWVYLFGFVLGGVSVSALRSFVEHMATANGTRSAVVKAGPVLSLLLLNINLHHTHHELPDVPWYDIPAAHREMGSDAIAAQGAGYYRSYFEVLRKYFFTPFSQPDHPLSAGARQ